MKWIECGDDDHLFEHECGGVHRWFNVTAMAQFAIAHGIEVIETDTNAMSTDFLRTYRGIEEPKLAALTDSQLEEPVIIVEMRDGTHLLVDGHHRWVRRAERGDANILARCFPLGTWEPFLVTDLIGFAMPPRAAGGLHSGRQATVQRIRQPR